MSSLEAALIQGEGTAEERKFPYLDEPISIGRGRENQVQIKRDLKVSRFHCRIVRRSNGYVVEDLKSSNGTFVNGEPIGVCDLRAGDELAVGDARFVFRMTGSKKVSETTDTSPKIVKDEVKLEPLELLPEPVALDFAPENFGRYYLVDRIAQGGMAEIFKAKTFGAGGFENVVVVKRILPHLSANRSFVQMFLDEAKVTALLQHSNIVRIYDFGRIERNYYISMECIEGKDTKQLLKKLGERRKLLPKEFAVYIAMEAAKGLEYAHKRNHPQSQQPLHIVHRDVSPSNVLISYEGDVKVADFGIVKAANCAEEEEGMLKGKFEYMSPEQADARSLDRRSDIFSLGIILWEMLTGKRLFKAENEQKTLDRIRNGEVELPSLVNPAIPARLDEIVMRALEHSPLDRYPDAREMHADLLDFLYPAAPDVTKQSLAHFMRDIFSEDMNSERMRMEEGTRIAQAMYESTLEPEPPLLPEPESVRDEADGNQAPVNVMPPPTEGGTWLGRLVGRFFGGDKRAR